MTRSLVKLIDASLLPASILVVGKFFGLFLTSEIFNLTWGIKSIPNAFFSVRPLFYSEDIILASTYSDIFMFTAIMAGFSFVLLQALFFHDSHIKPKVVARLASNNLLSIIKSSFDIYHKGAIWGVFLWVANLIILLNVLSLKTELWVFLTTILVSIFTTVLFLRDVYQEIEIGKKQVFSGKKNIPQLDLS